MASYMGFIPDETEPYFFISYNTEDKDRIQPILLELHKHGLPIWYDYGISYDENWVGVIAEKIDHCQAVLLFFSKGILEKADSFVLKEFKFAQAYEKRVYVIMLDDVVIRDFPYNEADSFLNLQKRQKINMVHLTQEDVVREICRATKWEYSENNSDISSSESNLDITVDDSTENAVQSSETVPDERTETSPQEDVAREIFRASDREYSENSSDISPSESSLAITVDDSTENAVQSSESVPDERAEPSPQEDAAREISHASEWRYSDNGSDINASESHLDITVDDCTENAMQSSGTVPYEGTEPYIFVSYARKDRADAIRLISELQSRGYRVWFDEGISLGTEWDEPVAHHLENCSSFISLITEHYWTSPGCVDELNYATVINKNIVIAYLKEYYCSDKQELTMRVKSRPNIHRAKYQSNCEFIDRICRAPGIEITLQPQNSEPGRAQGGGLMHAAVTHNVYGHGIIISVNQYTIGVLFSSGVKTFPYPNAFDHSLRFQNEDLQRTVRALLASHDTPVSMRPRMVTLNLVNAIVYHKAFGRGTITDLDDKYISVKFKSGAKTFPFPDAFKKHLKFQDEELQRKTEALLKR